MKNIRNILGMGVLAMLAFSCDRAGQFEAFNEGTEPAALAAWVSEPSGDLLLSDPTSAVSFEIEFVGTPVSAFELSVTDEDDNTGVLISAATSGNFSGSFSVGEIATALGVDVSSFSEGDEFTFSSTLTSNGIVYRSSNGNTREFNVAGDFDQSILTETTELIDNSLDTDGIIRGGQAERIFLEFENDLGSSLATRPTITRTSTSGNTDDTIGEVQEMVDEDGNATYYFDYTAGAADSDVISFEITAASAVSVAGFEMEAVSLSSLITVDNVAPTLDGNASAGNRVLLVLSEEIGAVTATLDGTEVDISMSDDGVTLDYIYAGTGAAVLNITVEDNAGNTLDLGDFNLTN